MIRVLAVALALCAVATVSQAADNGKPQRKRAALTEEQKKEREDLIKKYDKNKDGKLDAAERKAFSAEDKQKFATASGRGQRKKGK